MKTMYTCKQLVGKLTRGKLKCSRARVKQQFKFNPLKNKLSASKQDHLPDNILHFSFVRTLLGPEFYLIYHNEMISSGLFDLFLSLFFYLLFLSCYVMIKFLARLSHKEELCFSQDTHLHSARKESKLGANHPYLWTIVAQRIAGKVIMDQLISHLQAHGSWGQARGQIQSPC